MINPEAKLAANIYTNVSQKPTRDGFGDGVVEAGKVDKNVVLLCCDLTDSTKSNGFKKAFPERFIEVGIQEQNMAGVAAGMSFAGKIPFITSYAAFNPGRNWDQLRVSICYSEANVKMIGAHAGISVGPDGATHQAMEDIAITRVLPNLTVIVPCDYYEAKKATIAMAKEKGPFYMRFGRENVPIVTSEETSFEIGKAQTFRHGKDATIIACGPLVYEALIAAKDLESEGIDVRVINMPTIKPLDKDAIVKAAKETGAIVTAEEHQITGGLGGAVAECV
ncbi:MAG TPA: transketolase C-terminal domain-containing protein, partial [Candidatus Nanoarchaeia archaeon]|nr:transketolase C-terminal domain-containing protein [Candidatus Nanoarchaeia archaeon]